jgi:hypothetical protein
MMAGLRRSSSLSFANVAFPLVLAAASAVGGLAACEAPTPRPPVALVTLADLRAGLVAAPSEALGAGLSKVFPAGFPPSYFLASPSEIRIAPAFTEAQASAYISTDIWVNFPEIWAQPLYVFIAAGGAREPAAHQLPLPWVMSVGPGSAFWSPYFRVFYVEVPPDTAPTQYRTVRAILNAKLPLHEGPTRLVTFLPDPAMGPEDPSHILLPALREPGKIGLPARREVWVDGKSELQTGLDFGTDRFELGPGQVPVEQPLFFFFAEDSTGAWVPLTPIPRVGGTGPLFANQPPRAPGNRPIFGSYWRLYAVHLPSSARLFVPRPRRTEWQERSWRAPSLPVTEHPAALDVLPGIDAYAFRVLLNDACLGGAAALTDLAACPWLDSQAALERHLPSALYPSEITVTCPYVAHAGEAVPPPGP